MKFVYDVWNLIEILDATDSNSVAKTYTWGLDLSQSLQGAGGVGGLLAVTEHGETADTPYYTTYDSNRNVSEYHESDGSVVVHYEYSLFGRLTLVDSETGAPDFNHRFSTKYLDDETKLYYYGMRYYSSELGRWPSRDPLGDLAFVIFDDLEDFGGFEYLDFSVFALLTQDILLINDLRVVDNNPIDHVDELGIAKVGKPTWESWQKCKNPKVWKKKPGGTIPKADGCSAPKLLPGPPDNPTKKCSFKSACNYHDYCYSDCSKRKADCDTGFLLQMNKACSDCGKKMSGKTKKKFLKKCYGWASKYHWAVKKIGNKPYKNRQTKNCDCVCTKCTDSSKCTHP